MSRSPSPSILVCTFLLACGAAMHALASGPASPANAAQPAAVAEAEEGKVCTREAVTGSTRKQRVCTTAAERAQARDKAQAEIHQAGRCAGNEVACRSQL